MPLLPPDQLHTSQDYPWNLCIPAAAGLSYPEAPDEGHLWYEVLTPADDAGHSQEPM